MNPLTEYKELVRTIEWTSQPWFITITIRPELYKLKAKSQYKKTIEHVKHILNMATNKYVLVVELTKNNNIHYHAIAEFKENNTKVMASIIVDVIKGHSYLGMTKVNDTQVQDINMGRTIDYLFKDYNDTFTLINFTGYGKTPDDFGVCFIKEKEETIKKAKRNCIVLAQHDKLIDDLIE